MATSRMRQKLAPYQIKWIASEVSLQSLKNIALKFMDFTESEIDDVFRSCLHDDEVMKSALLQEWARRNSDGMQVQVNKNVLFDLLMKHSPSTEVFISSLSSSLRNPGSATAQHITPTIFLFIVLMSL